MAFPKNKSRSIQIDDIEYNWICIQEQTMSKPIDVEPDEKGVLPPLSRDIDWYGYEDVYGYNSRANVFIQWEKIKVQLKFDRSYFYGNVLNPTEIQYLSIKPGLIKMGIEYLNRHQLWTNNRCIENGASLFKKYFLKLD